MPQLEFRENKTLKLINILSRRIPTSELMNQGKQVQMLMNWVNIVDNRRSRCSVNFENHF